MDVAFLPREEPEARELMLEVLRNEGVRYLEGLATAVGPDGGEIVIDTPSGQSCSELLLVATGRAPNLGALGLEKAGVRHSSQGIEVDDHFAPVSDTFMPPAMSRVGFSSPTLRHGRRSRQFEMPCSPAIAPDSHLPCPGSHTPILK